MHLLGLQGVCEGFTENVRKDLQDFRGRTGPKENRVYTIYSMTKSFNVKQQEDNNQAYCPLYSLNIDLNNTQVSIDLSRTPGLVQHLPFHPILTDILFPFRMIFESQLFHSPLQRRRWWRIEGDSFGRGCTRAYLGTHIKTLKTLSLFEANRKNWCRLFAPTTVAPWQIAGNYYKKKTIRSV